MRAGGEVQCQHSDKSWSSSSSSSSSYSSSLSGGGGGEVQVQVLVLLVTMFPSSASSMSLAGRNNVPTNVHEGTGPIGISSRFLPRCPHVSFLGVLTCPSSLSSCFIARCPHAANAVVVVVVVLMPTFLMRRLLTSVSSCQHSENKKEVNNHERSLSYEVSLSSHVA